MNNSDTLALFVNIVMYIVDFIMVTMPLFAILYLATNEHKPKIKRLYHAIVVLHILGILFGLMILVVRGLDQDRTQYTIVNFVYTVIQTSLISTLILVDIEFMRTLLPILPPFVTRKRMSMLQLLVVLLTIICYLGVYSRGLFIYDVTNSGSIQKV